jgi:hypothetical protein
MRHLSARLRPHRLRPGTLAAALTLAGALSGLVAMAVFVATRIDASTLSALHNASARRADLAFATLAALAAATTLAVWATSHSWYRAWMVAPLGVLYGTLAAEAITASGREDRAAALVLLAVAPSLAIVVGAAIAAWGVHRGHLVAVVALASSLALAPAVLAATVLADDLADARLFANQLPGWRVERRADHVSVDSAGRAWGVTPWELASPASLLLRDPDSGEFRAVRTRAEGWPPTLLGSDRLGRTWWASSALENPFQPVLEVESAGRFSTVAPPAWPLPPLDAVALGSDGTLAALHADHAGSGALVLEIHDDGGWRAVRPPLPHRGRTALVDLAVDDDGSIWIWHEAAPSELRRFHRDRWTTVPLPFVPGLVSDVRTVPVAVAPPVVFVPGPDDRLRLHDEAGRQLVTLDTGGRRGDPVPVPTGRPVVVDGGGRVWVARPGGVAVVAANGTVLYDSGRAGLPSIEVESVAVGEDHAWIAVRRERARAILRFDHGAALARVR